MKKKGDVLDILLVVFLGINILAVIAMLLSMALGYTNPTYSTSGYSVSNNSQSGLLNNLGLLSNFFQIFKSSSSGTAVQVLEFDDSTTNGISNSNSIFASVAAGNTNFKNLTISLYSNSGLVGSYFTKPSITESGWRVRENPDYPRFWYSVASSADGKRLAAIIRGIEGVGTIYTSADSGDSWIPSESGADFTGIATSSDGANLVATSDDNGEVPRVLGGYIHVSDDFGENWNMTGPRKFWTSVASSSDGKNLVAASDDLYISNDYGKSWNAAQLKKSWTSVASSSDGKNLVAASDDLYISNDYGKSWNAAQLKKSWTSVASSSDGKNLVAASDDIYVSDDFGKTWNLVGLKKDWSGVATSSDGLVLYAFVRGEYIYSSFDFGKTWNVVSSLENWKGAASSADGNSVVAAGDSLYTNSKLELLSSHNFTGLLDGNYYLNATAYDSDGNLYQTETRGIEIQNLKNNQLEIINLADCGEINFPGYYILQKNISANLDCLQIKSDDVVVDCKGHEIKSINGKSILISGEGSDIQIKNCVIISKNSGGIYSSLLNNSEILDNSINSKFDGIFSEDFLNSSIFGNNITSVSDGISFNQSDLASFFDNTIVSSKNSISGDGGISDSIFLENSLSSGNYDFYLDLGDGLSGKNITLKDQKIGAFNIKNPVEITFENNFGRISLSNFSGTGDNLFGELNSNILINANSSYVDPKFNSVLLNVSGISNMTNLTELFNNLSVNLGFLENSCSYVLEFSLPNISEGSFKGNSASMTDILFLIDGIKSLRDSSSDKNLILRSTLDIAALYEKLGDCEMENNPDMDILKKQTSGNASIIRDSASYKKAQEYFKNSLKEYSYALSLISYDIDAKNLINNDIERVNIKMGNSIRDNSSVPFYKRFFSWISGR